MAEQILIKNGKAVLPHSILEADILIGEDGKIAKIARNIRAANAEEVNAAGLLILPGAIDSHVHFRDPEDISKEDFYTGSTSALAGGVTTVMDMPNYRNPPTTTIAAYEQKRQIASSKSRCDFLLRFGASETNHAEAIASNAPSLKVFLTDTHSELCCSKESAVLHFKLFPHQRPICVHAEDWERITERQKKFKRHEQIRDKISAFLASKFSLEAAAKFSRRIHLCHLTTEAEIRLCRRYKNATYEVTPSHLFLSTADLERLGKMGKINPPLRDKKEVAKLWRCIGKDTIIATDHAPHLVEHKESGAPGFPGVGTMLPLLLNAAKEKKLSYTQISLMCAHNPSLAFGLQSKGAIEVGKDADLVLVDKDKKWKITAENRFSKCNWTPFEGKEVYGKIVSVFLRGKLVYDGEEVLARAGDGKEVACKF
ncbi:MAG: dihydroorotase [Candidatus Micrarchaeota archaeon]|nr:dihydroorotase [Candidatus Micrarchaeota archaeon]